MEAVNKCGSKLSFCQTVLPGNEAMLIPTLVESKATIAVPDESYWAGTAAQYVSIVILMYTRTNIAQLLCQPSWNRHRGMHLGNR